jgi:DNA-directed RNA polymerase beta' subunit
MGHIELAAPVAHIWFLKSLPSRSVSFGSNSEFCSAISLRKLAASFSRSKCLSISRIASAPICAMKLSCPHSFCALMYSFGQELAVLQRGQPWLQRDGGLEVEDALEVLDHHVEQQADAARPDRGLHASAAMPQCSQMRS